MKYLIVTLISAVSLHTLALPIAPLKTPSLKQNAHFFENSKREDITSEQARFLVKVKIGAKTFTEMNYHTTDEQYVKAVKEYLGDRPTCSAFFIANKSNKFFIGSSRHCFGFKAEELLKRDDVTIVDFATGHTGRGVRVVAEDPGSDFFVFEADFGDANEQVRTNMQALTIGLVLSPKEDPIQVFGFPGDEERMSRPTVSKDCHIFSNEYDPEWKKLFYHYQKQESIESSTAVTSSQSDGFNAAVSEAKKDMYPIRHNCSIYGGNSGGPAVYASEPLFLVGIPESYNPSKQVFAADQYGYLESPYVLVVKKTAIFDSEGIIYEVRK